MRGQKDEVRCGHKELSVALARAVIGQWWGQSQTAVVKVEGAARDCRQLFQVAQLLWEERGHWVGGRWRIRVEGEWCFLSFLDE